MLCADILPSDESTGVLISEVITVRSPYVPVVVMVTVVVFSTKHSIINWYFIAIESSID